MATSSLGAGRQMHRASCCRRFRIESAIHEGSGVVAPAILWRMAVGVMSRLTTIGVLLQSVRQ